MAVKKNTVRVTRRAGSGSGSDGPAPVVPGLFYDAPGDNSKIEGGIRFPDLFGLGLGNAGISFGPSATFPNGTRFGFGANTAPVKRAVAPRAKPQAQDRAPLTFADYLQMANEMGLGGSGTDYAALMNQLRANAANADAKLAAMYGQLQNSIDADAAGIAQNFDTNGQNLNQNAASALDTINNAYQAARDAQTQQFQQLGIQDAAGVLAAQGGAAAGDQANAVGNVAQNSGANAQQNAQNRTAALNYNTGISNAAGLEGAVQRAAVQQELANRLAELQTQQSSEGNQRSQSLFQAALGMAQNPSIFDPNYKGNPMDALKAQLLAAQVTAQDLKNQGLAANSSGAIGGNLSQYQTLAQAYGIDPSDQEAFLNFIKLVNETQ